MKWTIGKKLALILFGGILVLATLVSIVNYFVTKENLIESSRQKLISDVQLSLNYVNEVIPGEWHIKDGQLYKGETKMVENYEIVDKVKELTGGNTVTIFQDRMRISTTSIKDGKRSINTQIDERVAKVVIEQKKRYAERANVVGEWNQTAYEPLYNSQGEVIGIWGMGVPESTYTKLAGKSSITVATITLLISFMIIMFSQMFTQREIVNPIKKLRDNAQEIANLNLNVDVYNHRRKDELNELASAFAHMKKSLTEIITNVSENATQVAESAKMLAEASNQSSEATSQISATINEIAEGTTYQSEEAGKIAQMMEETVREVQASYNRAEDNLKLAKESTEIARVGEEAINQAIKHLGTVTDTVKYATDSIQNLGKRSEEIGGIITVITGISEQTNLLALNAAIEAARAGEQGKGFAVVAEEVRKLAEEASSAAGKITDLIKDIQAETSVTVRTMESNLVAVNEQVMIINRGGEALKEIVEKVEETEQGADQIMRAFELVKENSQKVEEAIQNMTSVIEESAASTEEVAATSEEQSGTIEEITANTNVLADIADKLRNEVNKFKF